MTLSKCVPLIAMVLEIALREEMCLNTCEKRAGIFTYYRKPTGKLTYDV